MKQSVEWYEDTLKSMKSTLVGYERELYDLHGRVDRLKSEITERELQIVRAKAMGKDSFDAERFMKSRRK